MIEQNVTGHDFFPALKCIEMTVAVCVVWCCQCLLAICISIITLVLRFR